MPSITDQQRLGWGNPDADGFAAKNITRITAAGISVNVNREMATIFTHLIRTLDGWGANLDQRADDWGYANRDIRGVPGSKSYHAWGLAVDLDATENPMGVRKTTFPVNATLALCKTLGLRWGYTYSGRPDSMHFEFIGSVAQARAISAKLRKRKPVPFPLPLLHKFGRTVLAKPARRKRIHDGSLSKRDENGVRVIQRRLKVAPSGFFDEATRKAVKSWEAKRGLPATGCIDKRRWKRLVG